MSELRLPRLREVGFLVVLEPLFDCPLLVIGILLVGAYQLELYRSRILLLGSLSIRIFSITGGQWLLLLLRVLLIHLLSIEVVGKVELGIEG